MLDIVPPLSRDNQRAFSVPPLSRDNQRAFSFRSQDGQEGFISLLHCSCFAKPSVRWEGSSKLRIYRTNLNLTVKVLDFVQLGGALLTGR